MLSAWRIDARFEDCCEGVSRLCLFSTSRRTPLYVLAVKGSEGCESLVKYDEKENEDVVGSSSGKGMIECVNANQ